MGFIRHTTLWFGFSGSWASLTVLISIGGGVRYKFAREYELRHEKPCDTCVTKVQGLIYWSTGIFWEIWWHGWGSNIGHFLGTFLPRGGPPTGSLLERRAVSGGPKWVSRRFEFAQPFRNVSGMLHVVSANLCLLWNSSMAQSIRCVYIPNKYWNQYEFE